MKRWEIIFISLALVGCTPAEHKAAQNAVKLQLLDPGSAEFRAVETKWVRQSRVVCGEVNAKNRLGGYVGFRAFVYFPDQDSAFLATDEGPKKFSGC